MVGNHQETRNDKIKTLNESTCWLNQQQMAVGYRVRGVRGNQFKQWATEHIPIFFLILHIMSGPSPSADISAVGGEGIVDRACGQILPE